MPISDDPRAALVQLMVRLRVAPEAERPAAVEQLLPLLGDSRVPLGVRMAAAALAVESLPDTPEAIRGVVQAVTAGLTPARALHRLIHLQHITDGADALDAAVEAREQKVKLDCPRCGVQLPRAEMAKHLWHDHGGLTLVQGKTRSRAGAVQAIRREYAALGDPALFDRAAGVGGEAAVGAWAAESASPEELLPLCAAAGARGVSLCPACLADVPPAAPRLPALAVAHGRAAGDGHSAAARGAFPPRVIGTVAALAVLLAFMLVAPLVRGRFPLLAVCFLSLAGFAYLVTLLALWPRRAPGDAAIDAAWRKLAPRLADRGGAARFLTRLCLTSLGRGDPMERARVLGRIIARARENPDERQLLAAALVLRVDDGARFGRDLAQGIAELAAEAFNGQQPADFAAFVLEAYLGVPREPAERARLRVLLYAAAFDAGLTARDVIELCGVSPPVAEAMGLPPHHAALLYGVWLGRVSRPWAAVGEARTVFELAETAPASAGGLLADEPGALLVCPTDPDAEAELGPLRVTASGVSLGGLTVSDPGEDVRVEGGGRELVFGSHLLRLSRSVPATFAADVKAWLRFRAEVLAAYPATHLPGGGEPASRLLAPFAVNCPSCGTRCATVAGAVARRL
jgi:hypothetical protein